MKKLRIISLILVIIGTIGILPSAYATDTTYVACPDSATFLADIIGGGVITFDIGATCDIHLSSPAILASDTTFVNIGGNTVAFYGDLIAGFEMFSLTAGVTFTVDGIDFNDANSGSGGAIFNNGGTVVITNSTFTNNIVAVFGGAIYNNGNLTITNSSFGSNNAGDGGAIYSMGGSVSITNTNFSTNTSANVGGAIYLDTTNAVLYDVSFLRNIAGQWGGAIGLSSGSATITNSPFAYNEAQGVGVDEFGGAIFSSFSTLNLTHNTFVGNVSPLGATIYHFEGAISAFANLFVDGDCAEDASFPVTVSDDQHNISHNATGCLGATIDPMLISVITPTNPVIEYAPACLVGVDFQGNPRPLGTGCTPGVVEIDFVDGVVIEPASPANLVLGCVFDAPTGVEIANAPDNTYCRLLMRNGGVIDFSGAIPADLIGLGVKIAVDVYRLEGGQSINTFPDYARICLAGTGRFLYIVGRQAPP
jgi:predicted outer membrane repeat protein